MAFATRTGVAREEAVGGGHGFGKGVGPFTEVRAQSSVDDVGAACCLEICLGPVTVKSAVYGETRQEFNTAAPFKVGQLFWR